MKIKRILALLLAAVLCTGTVFASQKLYISPEMLEQITAQGQSLEGLVGDEYELIVADENNNGYQLAPGQDAVWSFSDDSVSAGSDGSDALPPVQKSKRTQDEAIAEAKAALAHLNITWAPATVETLGVQNPLPIYCGGGVFHSNSADGKWGGMTIYHEDGNHLFIEGIRGSFQDVPYAVVDNEAGEYGAIDANGNFTIPFGRYDSIQSGDKGRLRYVWKNGMNGIVDISTGEELLPCVYQMAETAADYDYNLETYFAEEALLPLYSGGKCGYVNRQMQTVIPFEYDSAGGFCNGHATVTKGGRDYIINRNNDRVGSIPAGYEGGKPGDGMVMIWNPDDQPVALYGYCDFDGNIVVEPQYTGGDVFQNGVAIVYSNGDPAVIDRNGNYVIPFGKYDVIRRTNDKERLFGDIYLHGIISLGTLSTALLGTDGTMYVDNVIGISPWNDFENGVVAYHVMEECKSEWGRESFGYIDRFGNVVAVIPEHEVITSVTDYGSRVEVELNDGTHVMGSALGRIIGSRAPIVAPTPQTDAPQQANYTGAKILVNGKQVAPEVYNINDNNYFKLRDLAKLVSGSGKQFEVSWNGTKSAINLVSGKAYTPAGGELAAGDGGGKTATPNASPVFKNGASLALAAYTIDGYNYFKLRDICRAFDIGVTWDEATQTVGIDTSIGYTE